MKRGDRDEGHSRVPRRDASDPRFRRISILRRKLLHEAEKRLLHLAVLLRQRPGLIGTVSR